MKKKWDIIKIMDKDWNMFVTIHILLLHSAC